MILIITHDTRQVKTVLSDSSLSGQKLTQQKYVWCPGRKKKKKKKKQITPPTSHTGEHIDRSACYVRVA